MWINKLPSLARQLVQRTAKRNASGGYGNKFYPGEDLHKVNAHLIKDPAIERWNHLREVSRL